MSKLNLDLRVGESINFDNDRIKITLLEKSGQRARLEINAQKDVVINTTSHEKAANVVKNGLNLKDYSRV